MNHDLDYDRDHDREDAIQTEELLTILKTSLDQETELMRTYLNTAERLHHDHILKDRLSNFAEGNAKRTRQLIDEIRKIQ